MEFGLDFELTSHSLTATGCYLMHSDSDLSLNSTGIQRGRVVYVAALLICFRTRKASRPTGSFQNLYT